MVIFAFQLFPCDILERMKFHRVVFRVLLMFGYNENQNFENSLLCIVSQ